MTCQHHKFEASVAVGRLLNEHREVANYTAEVRVHCAECGLNFQFVGMPMGSSNYQPMKSADGLETRLPIAPTGIDYDESP